MPDFDSVRSRAGGDAPPSDSPTPDRGVPQDTRHQITQTDRSESEVLLDLKADIGETRDYQREFHRRFAFLDGLSGEDPDMRAARNAIYGDGLSGFFKSGESALSDGRNYSTRSVGSFSVYGNAQRGTQAFQSEVDKVLSPQEQERLENEAAERIELLLSQDLSLADIEAQLQIQASHNSTGHEARVFAEMKRILTDVEGRAASAHEAVESDNFESLRKALVGADERTMNLVKQAYHMTFTPGENAQSLEEHAADLVARYVEEGDKDTKEARELEGKWLLQGFSEEQASEIAQHLTENLGSLDSLEGFNWLGGILGPIVGLSSTTSGAGNYADVFHPGAGKGLFGPKFGLTSGFRWTQGVLDAGYGVLLGSGIEGAVSSARREDTARQLQDLMRGRTPEQINMIVREMSSLELKQDDVDSDFRRSGLRDMVGSRTEESPEVDIEKRAEDFLHNLDLLEEKASEFSESERLRAQVMFAASAYKGLTDERAHELQLAIARQLQQRNGVLSQEDWAANRVVSLLETGTDASHGEISTIFAGLPEGARESLKGRVETFWGYTPEGATARPALTDAQRALLTSDGSRVTASQPSLNQTATEIVNLMQNDSPVTRDRVRVLIGGIENRERLLEEIYGVYGTTVGPMGDTERSRFQALVMGSQAPQFAVMSDASSTYEELVESMDYRVQGAMLHASEGFDPTLAARTTVIQLSMEPAFLKSGKLRDAALERKVSEYLQTDEGGHREIDELSRDERRELERYLLEKSKEDCNRAILEATDGLNEEQIERFIEDFTGALPEKGEGDFQRRLLERMPLTERYGVENVFTVGVSDPLAALSRSQLTSMNIDDYVLTRNPQLRARDIEGFTARTELLDRTVAPIEADQFLSYMAGRDESTIGQDAQAARDRMGDYYDVVEVEMDPELHRRMRQEDPRFRDFLAGDPELAEFFRRDPELYEAFLAAEPGFRERVIHRPSDREMLVYQNDLNSPDNRIRESATHEFERVQGQIELREAVFGGDLNARTELLNSLFEHRELLGGFDYPEAERASVLESDPRYLDLVYNTPGLADVLEANDELRRVFREADPQYRQDLVADPARLEKLLAGSNEIVAALAAHPWSQGATEPTAEQWVALETARLLGVNAWKRSEDLTPITPHTPPRQVIDALVGGQDSLSPDERDSAAQAIIQLHERQYGRGVRDKMVQGYFEYARSLEEPAIGAELSDLKEDLPFLYSLAERGGSEIDAEALRLGQATGVNAWNRAAALDQFMQSGATVEPAQIRELLFNGVTDPETKVAVLQTVLAVHTQDFGPGTAEAFLADKDALVLSLPGTLELHRSLLSDNPDAAMVESLASLPVEDLSRITAAHSLLITGTSAPTFRELVCGIDGMPQEQVALLDQIDGSDRMLGAQSLSGVLAAREAEIAELREQLSLSTNDSERSEIQLDLEETLSERAQVVLHLLTRSERDSGIGAGYASTVLGQSSGTAPDVAGIRMLMSFTQEGTSAMEVQELYSALQAQAVGSLGSLGTPEQVYLQLGVARVLNRVIQTPEEAFDPQELQALDGLTGLMSQQTSEVYQLAFGGESLLEQLTKRLNEASAERSFSGATKAEILEKARVALEQSPTDL
ncbi:MAG: hypothetical protein KDD64_11255 [Bdellovibrionales bacterium]|nr:hypothetical protein [Bdellovibrionales bacterium]